MQGSWTAHISSVNSRTDWCDQSASIEEKERFKCDQNRKLLQLVNNGVLSVDAAVTKVLSELENVSSIKVQKTGPSTSTPHFK